MSVLRDRIVCLML